METLKSGRIYRNLNGKTVLVFGRCERKLSDIGSTIVTEGIGVNLDTGKVDQIEEFTLEVTQLNELSVEQSANYGHFYLIWDKMTDNSVTHPVVTISGKARSGKDTLAEELKSSGYRRTALGDAIRSVRNVLFGKSDKKNRDELIMIGQGLRTEDPNIWVKVWLRKALEEFAYDPDTKLVVTDVRQPNEFSFFKSLGAYTVRIQANEEKRLETIATNDGKQDLNEKLLNDETELHTDAFDTDLVLVNNYDKTFYEGVNDLISSLK